MCLNLEPLTKQKTPSVGELRAAYMAMALDMKRGTSREAAATRAGLPVGIANATAFQHSIATVTAVAA
jgi:hypothetical protein